MNKERVERMSKIYNMAGAVVLVLGFVLILVPVFPYLWYIINPDATDNEIETLASEVIPERKVIEIEDDVEEDPLPPVDPDLPNEPFVVIDKINVNSPIRTGEDYIEALKRGTWIVPNFGDPINNNEPIILAAHRFGYSSWSREFRNKISFFYLPDTEVGDKVEIIWDQRVFEYEIYMAEEANYITDYDADLILYTCKFYNSPIRIFRYARAIN